MSIKLSYSSMDMYRTCPYQYKLAKIDKIETEEETIETFMGSRVHEALEKLYKDLINGKRDTLNEVLEFYASQWKKNWHDKIRIVKTEYKPEHYFEVGSKCISGYYKRFHPFNQGIPIWIEKNFTIDLGDGIEVTGVVDRVDKVGEGKYEIHDYKTAGRLPDKDWTMDNEQLAIYQIALQQEFDDVNEVKLVWHYLRFETERDTVRTPEHLEMLKQQIKTLANEILNATEFPPKEGVLCDWCLYWKYCPMKRHALMIDEYGPEEITEEEGYKLATRYGELHEIKEAAESEMALIRDKLLQYARANNLMVVEGKNCEIKLSEYPRLESPKKNTPEYNMLREILIKAGVWESFSDIDIFRLSNAIRARQLPPPLMKEIEKICKFVKDCKVRCTYKKQEYSL
jgi:putative RecB family exonuclease